MTGAAIALALGLTLHAAEPARWEVSTAAQWLLGRSDQVAIDREGRITLGPALSELHEDTAPAVWDLAAAPDGTIYLGTGNDGRVLGFDGRTVRTVLDTDELQVHALAWHAGGLLAGTSPDGKVYRVETDGSSRVFFDPGDTYIWSVLVAPDGQVYVGTGGQARVHEVSADGSRHRVVFEAPAANVTALALDADGRLLVGTDNPGRLYRVQRDGKAFALMDGPHTQVQAIHPTPDGGAYVLAVSPVAASPAPASPPSDSTPTPVVTTEVSIVAVGDNIVSASAQASPAPGASASKGRGAIYRFGADGLSETVWDASSELAYDILVEDSGAILVAAEGGALYRLEGSPLRVSRLGQTSAQHVTRIVRQGARYLLAAANPGKLFALDTRLATEGTYTSDIRDAGAGTRWGVVRWDGLVPPAARAAFETRSGNTATPDATWDDWTTLRHDGTVARVASPPARYLQWRVALAAGRDGGAPVLDAVTVTYLGRNQRPRIASLTLHPPGVVFQQPFGTQEPPELAGYMPGTPAPAREQAIAAATPGNSGSAIGRRLYQKGFQTLQWDAQDPDGDELRFRVLVRRVGTDHWRPLASDLIGSVYTWDTTQLADGRYYVRVVASDGRANPPERALEGERDKGPLTIDNTPPVIQMTSPDDRDVLRFTVTDAVSPLTRVDVLLPDGGWRPVFPRDGVLDGLEEHFEVRRDALGEGLLVIRAADALANLTTLEVPPVSAPAARRR